MTVERLENREQAPLELMAELDPEQIGKLKVEIDEACTKGYQVEVAELDAHDLAYQRPDLVRNVFEYLHTQVREFAEAVRSVEKTSLAQRALIGIWPPVRRKFKRELYQALEPHRERLLYGADQTNSMPWHDQHGRALALLTIVEAHNLATNFGDDGQYRTMSGPIDETLLESDNLREQMIMAEVEFAGKTRSQAEKRVDKRLAQTKEFIGARVTPEFKEVVQYCSDSLGIRERKEVVNRPLSQYIEKAQQNGREISDMTMMSFGCGTALPVMEMIQQLKQETGEAPTLILLDQDPLALAAAKQLAEKMSIGDNIEVHCKRLFSKYGSPADIKEILGDRQLDIGEDSGLREYLPDAIYKKLTKSIYGNLRPGGMMITSNMNTNRPQPEFLHGLMGWYPRVQMRTIRENFRLHEEAGVENTRAIVTPSGVYTILISEKSTV